MNDFSKTSVAASQLDDEINISRILGTLWRGKFWIIFVGLIGLFIGGYYAFKVAIPQFTTSATVVQETNQEPVVDFSGGLGGGVGGDQTAINTEIEVLRSRGLLEKVVLALDLIEDPEFNPQLRTPPVLSIGNAIKFVRTTILRQPETPKRALSEEQIRDAVVSSLRGKLSIGNISKSYVYSIAATTQNAKKSTAIVNTLANLYIRDQLDVKGESNLQATAWLTDRLSQLRIELETAEGEVKDFNARTDLINADTLAALNRQVKELRDRLDAVRNAQSELETQISAMEAAAIGGDAEQMAGIAQDRILTSLFTSLNQSSDSRAAFDARFEQLVAQNRLERGRMQTQIEALEQSISQQERETAEQSTDLITLQQLQREAEASRLLYEYFLGRLKETTVQSGIQTADSRVLSRAVEPLGPSAPRKPIILMMSLMMGLLAGAVLVLLREMSQSTFRAAEELEARTGYSVLGQIPKIPARRRAQLLKYLADKPTSIAAEAVRNMRTSVLLSNVDNPPQVIMSTSSIPGEGKTTQSLSLTQNLAGLGKSVLLVEGDVRKRVFAEYFNIKDADGFMAVLEGKLPLKDAVVHEPDLNADVLMSESPTSNAADIFSSHAFVEFMKKARKSYDYIVIDTPPVLAVPDARIIGRHVDTTLYTVRWDHTTQSQVSQGLKELAQVNVDVAGLVLAQIDQKGLKRYGYGDQANAGSGYHDN